jgi:phosphoribosyl 1,2-cyclic phosphodiesterase
MASNQVAFFGLDRNLPITVTEMTITRNHPYRLVQFRQPLPESSLITDPTPAAGDNCFGAAIRLADVLTTRRVVLVHSRV